ncbi:hypothetical protein [Microvirga subterranea]|nr:hypothetical protein [Microvirga subterranea]
MSDGPAPDKRQPDVPAPPQPDTPSPDHKSGLRPPEPSEPPGDDVPKVG